MLKNAFIPYRGYYSSPFSRWQGSFANENVVPDIRVKLFAKAPTGEFEPGHHEDFQLASLAELAGEIEKFIQFAVGKNIKE